MKNVYTGLLPKIHLWTDIIFLNISVFVAFDFQPDNWPGIFTDQFTTLFLIANLAWILTIHFSKPYLYTRSSYHIGNQLGICLKTVAIHGAVILGYIYLTKQGKTYSRYQFLTTYSLFIGMTTVFRAVAFLLLKFYRQAGYDSCRYAIVGKGKLAGSIYDFYSARKELGFHFHGIFDLNNLRNQVDSLEEMVMENNLDYVYCCISEMSNEHIRNVISMGERQKIQIRLVPDFKGFMNNKATIEYHGIFPIIQVDTKPFSQVKEQYAGRAFDLALAGTVMVLGLPVFCLIWAVAKLTSSGPVLYKQTRCGRWGETFEVYKFGSMLADTDIIRADNLLSSNDAGITPAGKFLRKSGLDRLPQFINVIKGDMSVFGPMPLYEHDVYLLTKSAPDDFPRLWSVRPGIIRTKKVHKEYADAEAKSTAHLNYDLQYLRT